MNSFLIGTIIAIAAVGIYIFSRRGETEVEDTMISLVFLLRQPRRLSEGTLREISTRALGVFFDTDNPRATEFVVPIPILPSESSVESCIQRYMLKVHQGTFMVHCIAMPYVEDPETFAEQIVDQRLRHAVAKHSGWVSVDVLGDPPTGQDKVDAYRVIGKLMAVIADDNCLAIYCPELQRCNEYDASLLETLKSDDPLALFDESTHVPVVGVDGEDPQMVAAVQEARERWPEFVAAFKNKSESHNLYLIKAEFHQGDCSEFMWMSVTSIEGNTVHGILENSPHELTNFKEGQAISVDLSFLNDWIYLKDEEGVGGFTMKVMKEQIEPAQG